MPDKPFYWHIFTDGHRCCTRGFSVLELRHMVLRHGALLERITQTEYERRLKEGRGDHASP